MVMGIGKRIVDGELVPDERAGWTCPGCGRPVQVFFGFRGDRRCRRCSGKNRGQR